MSQLFTLGGQSIGSFSFSISPSNEYSGLIYFRIDWLDLLVVQGTLKSLLQHYSSKASILQCSPFFGEGDGTPVQDSCLENPMDRGAWRATVHAVAESQTIKKAECRRIDAFELWLLEKTVESPLDYKEIKQGNRKGNQA